MELLSRRVIEKTLPSAKFLFKISFSSFHSVNPTTTTPTPSPTSNPDKAYFKNFLKQKSVWDEKLLERLEIENLISLRNDVKLRENLRRRLCDDKVNLGRIRDLWKRLGRGGLGQEEREELAKGLATEAMWIPNDTHKASMSIEDDNPRILRVVGKPKGLPVMEFQKYCEKHNLLKNDNLGNVGYHRGYYLKGPLAELEEGLIRFALDFLKKEGYQLVSVPDILYPHVIEGCGMRTRGDRDQVFWVELPDSKDEEACLAGTAEMSLGGSLRDRIFDISELPIKLAAVSRCFRAETSSVEEERGLYRVHEFTKVEMFGVTAAESGNEGETLHEEIRGIEENIFSQLELYFKTLEMPPSELGLPAFRKFDIEAWMPGRGMFGEISSCSNCTDFQSRRLNIRYRKKNGELSYVHTVNGTAVAIPRMLIALIESGQQSDGTVKIPKVVEKFMTRNWQESMKSHPQYKTLFLRTKSSQHKYTSQFRKLELN